MDDLLKEFDPTCRETGRVAWRPHLEKFVTTYLVLHHKTFRDLNDAFGLTDGNFKRVRKADYRACINLDRVQSFLSIISESTIREVVGGEAAQAISRNLERLGIGDLSASDTFLWTEKQDRIFHEWCDERRLGRTYVLPSKGPFDPKKARRKISGFTLHRLAFNMHRYEKSSWVNLADIRIGQAERKLLQAFVGDEMKDGALPIKLTWSDNLRRSVKKRIRAVGLSQTKAVQAMGYNDSRFTVLDSKGYVELDRLVSLAKALVKRKAEFDVEQETFSRPQKAVTIAKNMLDYFAGKPKIPINNLHPRVAAIVHRLLPDDMRGQQEVPQLVAWGLAGSERLRGELSVMGIEAASLRDLQKNLYRFTRSADAVTTVQTTFLIRVATAMVQKDASFGRPKALTYEGNRRSTTVILAS